MRDSPRSPKAKTNGSSREGNRIINPHSRIPKSTNKQTNSYDLYLYLYLGYFLRAESAISRGHLKRGFSRGRPG